MDNIDLNLFRTFDALFEEENATRAAIKIGVSQSAVSAALGRLRKIYDDPLFTRVQGGLKPTPRAIEIKPHVQDALNSVSKSLNFCNKVNIERFIKVGMSDDIEIAFGPKIIQCLREKFPAARPIISQSHSGVSSDLLLDKSIDIAIGSGGLTGPRIQRQSVGQSGYLTVSCVSAKDGKAFTLKEFLEREHLLISSSGLVGAVDEVLSQEGMRRKVAFSATHFATTDLLLTGTDYLATIPSHAARILAKRAGLFISPCPIGLKNYPLEVATTKSMLKDSFIIGAVDVIAKTLTELVPGADG
ncbi:MAG: LysR family transcriptional regulator [Halopseudomonas aestusnigri]